MEVVIDEKTIQEAFTLAVTASVKQSVESWEVKDKIKAGATTALMNAAVDTIVANALTQTDMEKLTKSVSMEITKTVTSLAVNALRETMINVVFELRKGKSYYTSEEERKFKENIKAELLRESK